MRGVLGFGSVGIQLHIPIEVIPPTLRRINDTDGNRDYRAPPRLHGLPNQPHPGFFRRSAAFPVVAAPAGRDDILPRLPSTLGNGHDVIEGELLRPVLMFTILAGIPVAGEDIDAGKLDRSMAVFQLHQPEQPHHGRKLDGNRDTVDLAIIDLEDFNLALPKQRNRFLLLDYPEGFVCGVEQKGHFHATTSFPTEAPSVRGPGIGLGTLMYFYAIRPLQNQALGHVATGDTTPLSAPVQLHELA